MGVDVVWEDCFQRVKPRVMPAVVAGHSGLVDPRINRCLADEPHGERIPVGLALAGFDGRQRGQHHPGDHPHHQQGDADQHQRRDQQHRAVDGDGDAEVERFAAGLVDEWVPGRVESATPPAGHDRPKGTTSPARSTGERPRVVRIPHPPPPSRSSRCRTRPRGWSAWGQVACWSSLPSRPDTSYS